MVVFMIQVITGIWLMMFYTNTEEGAFASVEYIMRDVEYGWLMRYMHSTGASAFFFLMYFHMFRGLLYGSYQKPKELVWLFGCFLLFLLMAEGFLGYVLPWGQMSYWAANVILSLFGAIPFSPSIKETGIFKNDKLWKGKKIKLNLKTIKELQSKLIINGNL